MPRQGEFTAYAAEERMDSVVSVPGGVHPVAVALAMSTADNPAS